MFDLAKEPVVRILGMVTRGGGGSQNWHRAMKTFLAKFQVKFRNVGNYISCKDKNMPPLEISLKPNYPGACIVYILGVHANVLFPRTECAKFWLAHAAVLPGPRSLQRAPFSRQCLFLDAAFTAKEPSKCIFTRMHL